ncbi:MAG TPA: TRAP transporter large permease, partial [Bacillota bacterium]|nr:TRAP transporter large permease [Bacillota bacterium]
VMVVSCGLFGAISGSGFATLSAIGSIMLPRMYEAGYPRGVSAALISSAALLGLLIPPSLNQILYAFVGGQSVLACFLATVGPGIILIILLSSVNFWLLRNNKDIKLADRIPKEERVQVVVKRTSRAIPAMIAPVIILGGIYGGFMTPTEAAAVSVVYTIPVGIWFYKGLDKKTFMGGLIKAGTTAGVVMLMLLSVMMLSRLYVMENLPQMILQAMTAISSDPRILTLMLNVFLIMIGMLMDDTSAILLTTPILLPVAMSVGINPVHFSAIVGVNIGLGGVTPPTAPFLYLGSRVANAPVGEMLKPTMFFILFAWIPTLAITTYVPELSLWLPRLLGYV